MTGSIAKVMMLSVALTLAVPESYAKRVGSGRSVGRSTPPSAMRQRSAPPQRAPAAPPQSARAPAGPAPVAPAAPVQRTQPDLARQSVPAAPVPPANRSLPSQASTPWGGMLGGALIGLGLGSLIGANRQPDSAQQPPAQTEGGNGNEAASGSAGSSGSSGSIGSSASSGSSLDPSQTGAAQVAPAEQPGNRLGSALLVGLAGLAIYFMMRRRRNKQRGF